MLFVFIIGDFVNFQILGPFSDADEAGGADSLDIFRTFVREGAAGELADVFLLEALTVALVADPTILRQTKLADPRGLQLLNLGRHLHHLLILPYQLCQPNLHPLAGFLQSDLQKVNILVLHSPKP